MIAPDLWRPRTVTMHDEYVAERNRKFCSWLAFLFMLAYGVAVTVSLIERTHQLRQVCPQCLER